MLDNGVTLCAGHHTFNYEFSAHRAPEAFTRWFKKTYPDRHKAIIKKAQTMMSEREAIQEFNTYGTWEEVRKPLPNSDLEPVVPVMDDEGVRSNQRQN
jgi:hypothetical protein